MIDPFFVFETNKSFSFYYLTGANFPGCSVTYDIAADKLTLWIPFTPPATILWFGNTPSPEECLAKSDVHDVKYVGELASYLSARLATVKNLYALRPSQLPRFDGFEPMKPSLKIDVTSLQPAMDEARLIKSEYEIAMIRKANEISSAAHKKAAMLMYGMKNECEIEAAFIQACTAANAHSQAYPVIAGSGSNASTLHYEANNESLSGRQTVVLDAGAEWNCYASDVTRTLPIGPRSKFSAEAKAIYDLVHKMQEECIERIKPGVVFRDLQLHATMVAVKGLLELGILRNGTAEEIYKNGTGAAFFPHGLGHHVGLDVHELVSPLFIPPPTPFKPLPFLSPPPQPPVPVPPSFYKTNRFHSVLSRDLLRPAGEGMWGKRRPIGPQSVRAMIKQAANEAAKEAASAATASAASSDSSNSNNSQTEATTTTATSPTTEGENGAPALPPRVSSPPPQPALTPSPSSPQPLPRITTSSPPPSPPKNQQLLAKLQPQNGSAKAAGDKKNSDGKGSSGGSGGKASSHRNTLQPHMIVTVEPGVYFCRPYVEAYFLRRDEHARYIDAEVLDRYWAVGGVRIEDDVLVTEDGCEDLTTAPKGDELLKLMGYS